MQRLKVESGIPLHSTTGIPWGSLPAAFFFLFFSGSCETAVFFSAGTSNLSLFCSQASSFSLIIVGVAVPVGFSLVFVYFQFLLNCSWFNEFNLIRSVDFTPIFDSYLLELFAVWKLSAVFSDDPVLFVFSRWIFGNASVCLNVGFVKFLGFAIRVEILIWVSLFS